MCIHPRFHPAHESLRLLLGLGLILLGIPAHAALEWGGVGETRFIDVPISQQGRCKPPGANAVCRYWGNGADEYTDLGPSYRCWHHGNGNQSHHTRICFVVGPGGGDFSNEFNAGSPPANACEGNPIHVGIGNQFQREIDLPPAGPAELEWTRYYNGLGGTHARLFSGSPGMRWTHTYSRRVRPPTDRSDPGYESASEEAIHTAELERPDGQKLYFHRLGETEESEFLPQPSQFDEGRFAVGTNQFPLERTSSGWQYRTPNGEVEHYDVEGRLQRIVDSAGFTQYLDYDDEGLLIRVRDDFDRSIEIARNADHTIARITAPDGAEIHYSYDDRQRLIAVEYADGSMRQYHYLGGNAFPYKLTGITDETGEHFATWQYDDQGRAILSEHAGGAERVEIEYRSSGTVHVTDTRGGERTYTLENVNGRMLPNSIDDGCTACSNASEWDYNEQGLPTRTVDRNGNVTTYQYNEHGLETSRTEAVGTPAERTITTDWDTDLRLPLAVHEPGLRTQYTYDARGRRRSKTETDSVTGKSRTTTWNYHPDNSGVPGQLAEVDGPRTDVDDITQYDYDADGNRIRVTNALGHIIELTAHDAYGRPLELVDPNGLVTELAYDARGRLRSRMVGGEVTTFGYDAAGNLTRIALPDGSELHYDYDPAQRLVALADEDGNRIDYTLDAAGNRIEQNVSDETGLLVRTQQQVFDELDRLIRTVGAQGQTTNHTYDPNGNRVSTTDPIGDATHSAFDALDRLVQVIDPLGGLTTYAYDANDRITAVTDPNGNTTRYTYDGLGNRTETDSPDSGITTYQHDAAGNVLTKVDAKGQTTQSTHDALNRLTRTEYHDGMVVTYTWDENPNGIGRLSRIDETDPDGATHATEWAYAPHGRVVERSQTVDDLVLRTQHAYDEAGRRIETVYPSGRMVTYTYDTNKLTGIEIDRTPILTGATYQPFGPVAGWTWGDGDVHSRTYDLDGRLTAHGLATGSPAGGTRRLDYTADNHIASITGPILARTYAYDGLDRLTAANDPDRIDSYAYDANGNRTSRTEGTETETYTLQIGSNRLLAISGSREVDYTYDENGNLIDDGAHTYTYSARDRLIQVDDGGTAAYRYNALGQRIHKQAGGGSLDLPAAARNGLTRAAARRAEAEERRRQGQQRSPQSGRGRSEDAGQQADPGPFAGGETYFVNDDAGRLIGRYDGNGDAIREYIYLGNLPVAIITSNGTAYYIHADHLGTPRAVSQPNGAIVWNWTSDPFGDSAPNEDPDGDGETFTLNLRFSGQYYDQETGLHQNWYRYYSPSEGRYLTSDPVGLIAGLNTFAYVGGNPLSWADYSGLSRMGVGKRIWQWMWKRFDDSFGQVPGEMDGAFEGRSRGDECANQLCEKGVPFPTREQIFAICLELSETSDFGSTAFTECARSCREKVTSKKYRKECVDPSACLD